MGIDAAFSSLTAFRGDVLVNLTVMALIIIGGLGFFIWEDVALNHWRIRRYRLHSKVALSATLCLILLPTILFFAIEKQNTLAGLPWYDKLLASLFQAVTPRTAGFNTVDMASLMPASVFLLIVLMLIGGSPGSTAGGMKTTTFAVLLLNIRALFQHQDSPRCFGRRIDSEMVRTSAVILFLYLIFFVTASLILCSVDNISLQEAMFESASALGTVGLSLGVTSQLSTISRLTLILLMYFGRVGCLTLLYAVAAGHRPAAAQPPLEKISVG